MTSYWYSSAMTVMTSCTLGTSQEEQWSCQDFDVEHTVHTAELFIVQRV